MKTEGVGTRLEKATETAGLNMGKPIALRCGLGGQYRSDPDP